MFLGIFMGFFIGVCAALVLPALKGAVHELNTIRRVKCWQVDFKGNAL